MHFVFRRLALIALASASVGPFVACHSAQAADTPHTVTPTIDIDFEDRAADKTSHVAHVSITVVDGFAQLTMRDGSAHYAIEAKAHDPQLLVKLKRSGNESEADLNVESALPARSGPRVLLAKVERADGKTTVVTAQVR